MSWGILLPSRLQSLSTSHTTDASEDIRQKQLHRCEQSANEEKDQKRPKEVVYHVSNVKAKKWGSALIATDLISMFV